MPLVYISGVHGAGKTTLIRNIKAANYPVTILNRLDIRLDLNLSALERAMLRATKYAIEYFRAINYLQANKKLYIGDRCIFDTLAYTEAYKSLGWIESNEYTMVNKMIGNLFCLSYFPKNIIYLSPKKQQIEKNLSMRAMIEGKGWKEDNIEYLDSVIDGYETIFSKYQGSINMLKLECNIGDTTMSMLSKYFETVCQP